MNERRRVIDDHDSNSYAHGPALHPLVEAIKDINQWKNRVVGGLSVIAFLIGGGAIDYIGHLNHWW